MFLRNFRTFEKNQNNMRQTLSIIIGLLLCCTLQAKNRVIDQPPFCVRSSSSIEVSKVVLSDTATVLHIYANYRPKYWIKIAASSYLKDNNGETYLLRSGIGITPDKEFWMPESGEAEFQLVFPPLPDTVTSIDFTEGEKVDNGYSIWGIQLKGKKLPALALPENVVVHKIDKNTELPEPVIQYGKGTLKGKLLDYHAGMFSRPINIALYESVKADVAQIPLTIDAEGNFNQEIALAATTQCNMYLPNSNNKLVFFLEPGKETELYINLRELSRQQSKFHKQEKSRDKLFYINGPLATTAQELSERAYTPDLRELNFRNLKAINSMSFTDFKAYTLQQVDSIQQEIDKLPVSKATHQFLSINNKMSKVVALRGAASTMTSAAIAAGDVKREEAEKFFLELMKKYPADYLADIDITYLNEPQSILADIYYYLVIINSHDIEKIAKECGTNKGVFFDVAKVAPIYRKIKGYTPLTEEDKARISALPQTYQEMLTVANEELLAKIEANKKKTGFTINEAGEISNEDLFASIISKFKGKVLLVDFWATWCGPCRMANKAMIPMKEELKDKDIVYLYITGETSPLGTWNNMIPDIHGEHYRLTQAQWDYLSKSFEIRGVPTYLIVDREGNIKYKQTGFPGVGTMKKELLKVVK